jgi:hypothetical protein
MNVTMVDFGTGAGAYLRSRGDTDTYIKFENDLHGGGNDGIQLVQSGNVMVDVHPTVVNVAGATFGNAGATFGDDVNVYGGITASGSLYVGGGGATFDSDLSIGHPTSNYKITVGRGSGTNMNHHLNTALGINALKNNTIGLANVAIGYAANLTNQDGNANTAVGYEANELNISGASNTAMGHLSLQNNLASNNTAVGGRSLDANTTGPDNTAIGYHTLFLNVTGGYNTAVGQEALEANDFGVYNTAVGYQALELNKSDVVADPDRPGETNPAPPYGSYNSALGYRTLQNNITGGNNTAVGHFAGNKSQHGYNTFIGDNAGSGFRTGSNNTFIGYGAGEASKTHANNEIVLGNNAVTLVHTAGGISAAYFGFPDGSTLGSTQTDRIGVHIRNGGRPLTTGKKGHRVLPYDCEVTEWTVTAGITGECKWDINWATYADWPNTTSVGFGQQAGIPRINGTVLKNTQNTLYWQKRIFNEGDIMEFEIDNTDTCTDCNLSIKIKRIG